MTARPNVLFLLSDEHSHRFLGCNPAHGEDVLTPTLDGLFQTGAWFTDTYCQMPLCTPSRISLLTGRHVRQSGAWTNESVLRPELDTIPRVFTAAGYETCLVGKMHLGGTLQHSGFNHRPYGDLTGKCGHQWEPAPKPASGMRGRTAEAIGVTSIPESLLQDQTVAQESVAFLREQAAAAPDQPWFLCASFSRPHFPLTAPKRWIDFYTTRGVSEPFVPAAGDAYGHPMSVGMREGFAAEAVCHDEMMAARLGYFACVSYLDEVLGDLLARLDSTGLLDNTIIVYTSDHGELAGEHGVWWKNGWYEGCTRVPLVVSTPEQRQRGEGTICATPVALLDLFPTLCSLCGVEAAAGLEGRDLSPAIAGGGLPDTPVCCDALTPRWGAGTEFRSIRYQQYKYVVFRGCEPVLFDLANDPQEQCNLLQRGVPEEAKAAYELLREFADTSIDFDAAEQERTVRDGALGEHYSLTATAGPIPGASTNWYTFPDGRVVAADEPLYDPVVLHPNASELFDR